MSLLYQEIPILCRSTGVITQSADADASIGARLRPTHGQTIEILGGKLTASNYVAGRTITIDVLDYGGNTLFNIETASMDNDTLQFGSLLVRQDTVTGSTKANIGKFDRHRLTAFHQLEIDGADLANAETITYVIEFFLWGSLMNGFPAWSSYGTNVTIVSEINKVCS